jgi:hypothetical protein
MNIRKLEIAAAVLALLMGMSVAARSQQESQAGKPQAHQHQKGEGHAMMMECHQNMQSIRQSNDKLKATIEAAKKSNDPAKMRAALDDAEKSIDAMNSHMDKCMAMMNSMHGNGMMGEPEGIKGTPDEQKKTPSATPPK